MINRKKIPLWKKFSNPLVLDLNSGIFCSSRIHRGFSSSPCASTSLVFAFSPSWLIGLNLSSFIFFSIGLDFWWLFGQSGLFHFFDTLLIFFVTLLAATNIDQYSWGYLSKMSRRQFPIINWYIYSPFDTK